MIIMNSPVGSLDTNVTATSMKWSVAVVTSVVDSLDGIHTVIETKEEESII